MDSEKNEVTKGAKSIFLVASSSWLDYTAVRRLMHSFYTALDTEYVCPSATGETWELGPVPGSPLFAPRALNGMGLFAPAGAQRGMNGGTGGRR